jgi:hypothetical protein
MATSNITNLTNIQELCDEGPDGTRLGKSATTSKVAFFAKTPIVQPTSASQAAPASTAVASITATQWGFSTSTQGNAVITCLIAIRSALVDLGLIKGS